MSEETDTDTKTLNSSSDTIELRFRQEPEIDIELTEKSADELTPRSVDEQIKQGFYPILKRVEELCNLLAVRTEMGSAGNNRASSSGRTNRFLALHVNGTTFSDHKFFFRRRPSILSKNQILIVLRYLKISVTFDGKCDTIS